MGWDGDGDGDELGELAAALFRCRRGALAWVATCVCQVADDTLGWALHVHPGLLACGGQRSTLYLVRGCTLASIHSPICGTSLWFSVLFWVILSLFSRFVCMYVLPVLSFGLRRWGGGSM